MESIANTTEWMNIIHIWLPLDLKILKELYKKIMKLCDGVVHNDSGTETLPFPKWEKESLEKILK